MRLRASVGENENEYEAVFTLGLVTATTTAATLTVDFLTITTQASSQTVIAGNKVTFTAAATANPSATVQWEVSSDGGSTFTAITGATSTSYSFTSDAG